ncbi:aspartic endopeptidase Pep1 aspergillopepsin F protein [Rutstroemia sp. NJR-2017a BVV2]|nr:aspartic endopeptidase Pep1 aspergillopepsin F protein [Rutstroemia sp. NJR-2017a BVV2]
MAALFWIRYFVALSVIPCLAWPTSAANGHRSFSINQFPREEKSQTLNISTAFARNILRYGGEWPRSVVSSAETASVLALSQNEEFMIPVSVGASTLHLTIDTGSSDLWVFSSQLPQDQREEHAVYKPSVYASKSSTQTWAIRYADGSSASGALYYDVVGVEGIWVMQQAVEIATDVSKNLAHNSASDGVLGLGFSNLNKVRPERQKTFFENAKLQLKVPLFAAILKQNASGSYDFGFIDKSKYIGELSYVDVDSSRGHWSFNVSGYDIGNGELTNDHLESVIDTGASLIFLPENIVRAYYQQVIGAENNAQFGEWTVPCSSFLPSFTTSIGDYKAVVLGDMLKLGPVVPGSSQCLGGIQSNMNARVLIFGHVFLKTQYVVFDDRGPRLGFARQF